MGVSVCTDIWVSVSGQTYGCLCLHRHMGVRVYSEVWLFYLLIDMDVCVCSEMWVFGSLCTDKWMSLDAQRCRCRLSAKRFGCLDLQRDVGTIICTEAWVFVSAQRCRCQSLHRDVDVSVCRELWMSLFAQR